jgi:hypothetical protein
VRGSRRRLVKGESGEKRRAIDCKMAEIVQQWPEREVVQPLLFWLRRSHDNTGLLEREAGRLVRDFGPDAHDAARQLKRQARSRNERRYWRDVASTIARITRKRIGLDIAETRPNL